MIDISGDTPACYPVCIDGHTCVGNECTCVGKPHCPGGKICTNGQCRKYFYFLYFSNYPIDINN